MEKTRLRNIFQLTKYFKKYSGLMLTSISVGIVYRVLPILSAFLLSYIIGQYTSGASSENFPIYFGAIFVIIILLGFGRYADVWFSHDFAYKILAVIRTKLYYKIEQLSPAFLKKNRSGNVLSIMMDDVNVLEWFYAHTLGVLFITVIISGSILVFLYLLHPFFMLTIIFWILVLVVIYTILKKSSEANGAKVRGNMGELASEITDGIHGIKDIVSLNWEGGYKEELKKVRQKYENSLYKDGHRRGMETSLYKTVIVLASVSILCLTAYLIQNGKLSSEWYLVSVVISGAIWSPINEFLRSIANIGLISGAAGRVLDILEAEPQVQDKGTKELQLSDNYKIEYDNILFTYPDEKTAVLHNISFELYSGETVAISGVSGSGKSTLANLLLRFYEFQQGHIKINGEDIRGFTLSSVRNQIAVVPQDIYLFNTSIWENVKISNPNATKEDITNALNLSGSQEFISELPNGYDTIVGERGARLSGGQKQRIAIARAILKDSKILILDEASSNLDYSNEVLFSNSLNELKKGRTTIIIAHRLSMLKMADRIVFIKDGKVNDIGTFNQLKQNNSAFCEMIGEA